MAFGQPALALDELAPSGVPAGERASDGGEVGGAGGLARLFLRTFVENRMAVLGAIVIVLMIGFCFLGPVFYRTNQTNEQQAVISLAQNLPPSAKYPLGTDSNGYDVLGRIMFGGQVSLEVGFAAAGIATLLGVVWGATAGYVGTWLDPVMMRIVDVLLSLPTLLLLIVLAVIFRPSEWLLIVVIGLGAWLTPARLVRGETLSLRTRDFVQAVKVMGGSGRRIVFRHIVPNTIGTIIVNATFQVADAILYLAALGFVGLGVPAPQTDWGSMLSQSVDYALSGYWWEIYPTGVAIVLVVVAFNFVGDALRDAFEVRLQRR